MKKNLVLLALILIVIIKVSGQDTLYLIPPTNLHGFSPALTDYVQLTWDAPVDSTTGEVPPGLLGYNIYRDGAVVGSIDHPVTEYYDLNMEYGTYIYLVSAVYDLAFYGFPGETGESPSTGPVSVTLCCWPELPFNEDFTTGVFETNQWTPDGAYGDDNWQIAGQTGNPAPSAYFTNYYPRTAYSRSLTSQLLNAEGYMDGNIFLEMDFRKQVINPTQTEFLFVDVFNGTEWIMVKEFTNDQSSDWQTYKINITNAAFGNLFKIRFRAEGESTANILSWNIDNIRVYRECEPATDFYASAPNFQKPCIVLCEWDYIDPNGDWLQWDNGINAGAIGTGSGALYTVASRFTPEQLEDYAGGSLAKIKFFPWDSAEFVLKVWTGDSASQLVLSQPVESYTVGEWNEITLDNPIYISGTTELWFGYSNDGGYGSWPVGIDSGPNVTGYGDLISLSWSGLQWETLTSLGITGNWNLAGFVDFPGKTTRSLTHFNVYRENEFIGSTVNEYYYDTLTLNADVYCYNVTAVYQDCESDFSNIDCYSLMVDCYVGVDDIEINPAELYPNPASSLVTVKVNQPIAEYRVYSLQGNQIATGQIPDRTTILDVSNYPHGIYLIKFIGKDGSVFAKKLIVE